MSHDAEFLTALFSHLPPGVIETRVIRDGRGGEVFARSWHAGTDDLIANLPRLRSIAENRHAGVFFGVMPRAAQGKGTAKDVLPGMAIWADLDFKRFAGGEEEARRGLATLPLPPTAVIESGHGLHIYYVLREAEGPDVLTVLSARLAQALGGDRVHDPARILRLPGTLNLKDTAHPVECRVEMWEASRRYNPSDLDEMLPPLAEPASDTAGGPTIATSDLVVGDGPPPRVKALIAKNGRVRALYEGHGKPATDEQGHALDTTSSGYDLSFLMSLAKHGIRNPAELARALWHRPDDAVRSKGIDYVARTVRRALALTPEPEASTERRKKHEKIEPDFTVNGIRAYASDPPVFEILINGQALVLSIEDLLSARRFRSRFAARFRRVPRLPRDGDEWDDLVNGWLAQAQTIDQPPESSPAEIVRQAIQHLIDEMQLGDGPKDLDHATALEHEGTKVFKAVPLLRGLQEEHEDVTAPVLGRELRALGYEPRQVRIEDTVIRVWGRFADEAATPGPAVPPNHLLRPEMKSSDA